MQGGIADVQGVEGFCVAGGDDLRVIVGLDVFQQMGGVMLATRDKSSNVVGKLQRGIFLIGLAESCPRSLILTAFVNSLPTCAFTDLNAGGLAEAQSGIVFVQCVQSHAVAHFHEIGVAGIGDGAGDIHFAVSAALPAIRLVFPSSTGVFPVAGVKHRFCCGGNAGFQRRHSGSGLQGRAGGVGAVGGAVGQGLGGIVPQLRKVLSPGGEVIGRAGGQCQNFAGADLDHSGGGTPAVQMVFLV